MSDIQIVAYVVMAIFLALVMTCITCIFIRAGQIDDELGER